MASSVALMSICIVVILAENNEVNKVLEDAGISSQTKDSVRNIKVLPAQCLSHAYQELGKFYCL